MKLTGAEILCESLVRVGVRHIFGYPGGAILPAYDALGKAPIHHILVRHEQGATHMSDSTRATWSLRTARVTAITDSGVSFSSAPSRLPAVATPEK